MSERSLHSEPVGGVAFGEGGGRCSYRGATIGIGWPHAESLSSRRNLSKALSAGPIIDRRLQTLVKGGRASRCQVREEATSIASRAHDGAKWWKPNSSRPIELRPRLALPTNGRCLECSTRTRCDELRAGAGLTVTIVIARNLDRVPRGVLSCRLMKADSIFIVLCVPVSAIDWHAQSTENHAPGGDVSLRFGRCVDLIGQ